MQDLRDKTRIYSVGHSDHTIEAFLHLLQKHQIAVVVDVRSQPYSQWVPQFNREPLQRSLEAADVRYVYLGHSLGGRPTGMPVVEPDQGQHRCADSEPRSPFEAGLETLLGMARQQRTAVMCAEGDHRQCHRDKLIAPALLKRAARVLHIQSGGGVVEARPEPRQLKFL